MTIKTIRRFQGFTIEHDPQEGYAWDNGGYFPTLEECKRDIAEWNQDRDEEHDDTPSLDEHPFLVFHRGEMDID